MEPIPDITQCYESGLRARGIRTSRLLPVVALLLALVTAACDLTTAGTNLFAAATAPIVTVPMSDSKIVPDFAMHMHGRWCGSQIPTAQDVASGRDLTPVDLVDAACMKHDKCYDRHGGRPDCRCDRELIWRLKYLQYYGPDLSAEVRLKMLGILAWFETSDCFTPQRQNPMSEPVNFPVGR